MAKKRKSQATEHKGSLRSRSTAKAPAKQRREPGRRSRNLAISALPERSQSARERSLSVLAAMRRDSSLSLTRAAKLEGVKRETVKRYFSPAFKRENGKFSSYEKRSLHRDDVRSGRRRKSGSSADQVFQAEGAS